jgi:hypothetical protein
MVPIEITSFLGIVSYIELVLNTLAILSVLIVFYFHLYNCLIRFFLHYFSKEQDTNQIKSCVMKEISTMVRFSAKFRV